MKTQRNVLAFVTLVLAVLFLLEKCKKSPAPCPEIVAQKVTHDTITGSAAPYVPIPLAKERKEEKIKSSSPIVYTPVPVSSGFVQNAIADCPAELPMNIFATDDSLNYYREWLYFIAGSNDTLGMAVVSDTLKNNFIAGRSYTFEIYRKTITNTVQLRPRNKYYWGLEAIGNQNLPIKYLGLNLAIKFKTGEKIIITGAGVMNKEIYYKAGALIKF